MWLLHLLCHWSPSNTGSRLHCHHFADEDTDPRELVQLVCDSTGRPQTPAFWLDRGGICHCSTAVLGVLNLGVRKAGWWEAQRTQLLNGASFQKGMGLRDCSGRPSSIPSSIWTGYSSSGNISQITDNNANCCSETKPSDDWNTLVQTADMTSIKAPLPPQPW